MTGYCDGPRTPVVEVNSVSTGGLTVVTRIIDGVPSLADGDQMNVAFRLTGAVSAYYRSPIAQISSSQTSTNNLSATGTPMSGCVLALSGTVTASNSKYIAAWIPSVVGYNIAGTSSSTANLTSNIRIDTTSTQPSSRRTASTGQYPTGLFNNTYDNNTLLTAAGNEELQLINGIIQYPSLTNYTTNVPAGPDYRNMPSGTYGLLGTGYRWANFNMGTIVADSSITLAFNSSSNFGSNAIVPGMEFLVRVTGTTPTNGWINGNAAYPGVGNPTNNGDAALVVGSSTATSKVITFGSATKDGYVFARVGIPSGSNKSFASLTMT
jgi:hypothetical protein